MQLAINPDLLLSVTASIAAFTLRTVAAFAACFLIDQLLQSATQRFLLWSTFVYGTAAYWTYLVCMLFFGRRAPDALSSTAGLPLIHTVSAWEIPSSWAWPAGLAMTVIGFVYLAIVSSFLFGYIKKRLHLNWVLSFSQQPPVEVAQSFRALAQRLHAGRSRLLVLSGATSPATFGWIRPTVLLPSLCLEQDSAELEDILRHELQHIRRCDSLWNGLARASRALLFFHPGLWYGVRRMQFERELACDLAVVTQAPARKEDYAECLLRFARLNQLHEPSTWGIDFAASAQHLSVRVHAILAAPKRVSAWLLGLRTVSGLALAALLVGVLPSMAVLLSYAHAPVPHLSAPAMQTVVHSVKINVAKNRRGYTSPVLAFSAQSTTSEPSEVAIEQPAFERAPLLSGTAGPHLAHRGTGSSNRSQSVSLADEDAGGKDTGLDRKQVLQQSATAALGMYRRVAALDRR